MLYIYAIHISYEFGIYVIVSPVISFFYYTNQTFRTHIWNIIFPTNIIRYGMPEFQSSSRFYNDILSKIYFLLYNIVLF